MEIKVERLHVLEGRQDSLRAICDVILGGEWAIRGVRVVEGEKGPFVALPARREQDGSYREYAHPVTAEARQALVKVVLAAYEYALEAARHPNDSGAARGVMPDWVFDRIAQAFGAVVLDEGRQQDGGDVARSGNGRREAAVPPAQSRGVKRVVRSKDDELDLGDAPW